MMNAMRLQLEAPASDEVEWEEGPLGWEACHVLVDGDVVGLAVARPDGATNAGWFVCKVSWNGTLVHRSEHHAAKGAFETAIEAVRRGFRLRHPARMKQGEAS